MAGVVGKALRGWGAIKRNKESKKIFKLADPDVKLQHPVIRSVKPAKRLTERRKDTENLFKIRQDAGAPPSKSMAKHVKATAAANTKYDKAVAASEKKFKSQKRKVIGAGVAAAGGATVAHGAAKKKWPKYKEVMESDVVIKDGKLGLRPKKKK